MAESKVWNLNPEYYPMTTELIHNNKVVHKIVTEGPGVITVPGRQETIGDAEGVIEVIITLANGEVHYMHPEKEPVRIR